MSALHVLDNSLHELAACGCSPYFVTSALSSLAFGEMGRKNQKEILEGNLEFREKMQKLRDDFSKERVDKQIAYRRESYEIGRQYQMLIMKQMNDNRQKEVEFKYLCQNCWPLNIDVKTVMSWQKELLYSKEIIPIKVLISKSDVLTFSNENGYYENFCRQLSKSALPGTDFKIGAWKSKCQSPLAETLNINYIMQGVPTLLLYPYTKKGKYYLEYAAWSFKRGNGALVFDNALTFPYSLDDPEDPKIALSLQAVIGLVRDNYMVLEFHKPAIFVQTASDDIFKYPEIVNYLREQYNVLNNIVLSSSEFRQICSEIELSEIENSLNLNIKLLENK